MTEGFTGEGPSTDDPMVTAHATRHFPAPAERVFDAWLDQRTVGRWLFATPEGEVIRAELEPHEGGRYVIVDRRDAGDAWHGGRYLTIDRPRRLVFTLSVDEHSTEADRITVEFQPRDNGECDVAVTHAMSPDNEEYVERTAEGWRGILDRLAVTLGDQTKGRGNRD